jgi:hypothetical protein
MKLDYSKSMICWMLGIEDKESRRSRGCSKSMTCWMSNIEGMKLGCLERQLS